MKRNEYVRVGLFPTEKAHIERRASALGISLAAALRLLVLEDMQRTEGGADRTSKKTG